MRLAYIPPSAPVYLDLTGVRRNVALCIHPVGSERDGRVFGMQLHVDVGGAGNQRELVALAGIQPFALNADCPPGSLPAPASYHRHSEPVCRWAILHSGCWGGDSTLLNSGM
nr:hypothetical protein [Serratia symbiotica]